MQNMHSNLLLLLVLLCAAGCGGQIKVEGKVTFSDDGLPLTAGTVNFVTETFEARGFLQADGTYKLSSVGKDDGVPPGKYRVYVSDAIERFREGQEETALEITVPLIDPKFASATESGLEFEVTSSQRKFDFKVDRPKK